MSLREPVTFKTGSRSFDAVCRYDIDALCAKCSIRLFVVTCVPSLTLSPRRVQPGDFHHILRVVATSVHGIVSLDEVDVKR